MKKIINTFFVSSKENEITKNNKNMQKKLSNDITEIRLSEFQSLELIKDGRVSWEWQKKILYIGFFFYCLTTFFTFWYLEGTQLQTLISWLENAIGFQGGFLIHIITSNLLFLNSWGPYILFLCFLIHGAIGIESILFDYISNKKFAIFIGKITFFCFFLCTFLIFFF